MIRSHFAFQYPTSWPTSYSLSVGREMGSPSLPFAWNCENFSVRFLRAHFPTPPPQPEVLGPGSERRTFREVSPIVSEAGSGRPLVRGGPARTGVRRIQ